MDAIRRGAMMRMGKLVAGAAATGAVMGNSQGRQFANDTPSINRLGSLAGYADKMNYTVEATQVDHEWQAREAATKPIYAKLHEMERSRRFRINENAYLENLKSVSTHWKHSVMLDREKKRATAIETLQEQIEKLRQSPLDMLDKLANDALGAFLLEMDKP